MSNTTTQSLQIRLELIWWLFTALVVVGVLYPIYRVLPDYQFGLTNTIFIVVLITLARYIFLLKHTFIAYRQTLKVVLFFLCLPLLFYLIAQINFFQTYLDENGTEALVGTLPFDKQKGMANYIYNEMLLFGVGSAISTVIFPLRLLRSVWLLRNRGRV